MQDEYTLTASHGFSYRLNEARLTEGKLLVTRHSVPKDEAKSELKNASKNEGKSESEAALNEIRVNDRTRVWKGEKQGKLSDLAAGDELLFNFTGGSGQTPRRCTDIWVGADHPQIRYRAAAQATFRRSSKRAACPPG